MLSLILRLYDRQRGAVLIDGRDLREVRQAAWRRLLAPVIQDNFLFDTSIREKRLVVLTDGDYFGEIALLQNVPRTASVRTLTSSVLLSLSRKGLLETLAATPLLREELERVLAERM